MGCLAGKAVLRFLDAFGTLYPQGMVRCFAVALHCVTWSHA